MRIQPGDTPLRIAAPKQRTLLAMLLAQARHTVPVHSLVAEVWDQRPPASAVANLRTYLMRLRHLLSTCGDHPDGERLVTSEGGYLLRVEPAELDLFHFETLSGHGRRSLEQGDLERAHDEYVKALALWRGAAVEDVPLGPALREVVAHLTDRYLSTAEEFTGVQLALGRHAAAAERLRALTVRHPLREGLHGRLMVALYRCGDVAGALAAFGAARQVLADELGVAPGPELHRLHQAILRREPDVELPGGPAAVRVRNDHRRPRQLPREPVVFVGRSTELAQALGVLDRETTAGFGAQVLALHGPAGAGSRLWHCGRRTWPPITTPTAASTPICRVPPRTGRRCGPWRCSAGFSGRWGCRTTTYRPRRPRRRPCTSRCWPAGESSCSWTTPSTRRR
ncbi:BTAD domain-containing putative transcriptional regulator [Nonomuraea antimicrobica]